MSGSWQSTTHAASGGAAKSGVVTFDSEFLKIDEVAGVLSGIPVCLASPRQSAGEALGPNGEVVGYTTAWGQVQVAFAVDGKPYVATVTVPEFRDHRPRRVEISDEAPRREASER